MIWNIIDWKSIALRINRLQLKIYKASLEKNIASVRKYQRTLLKSHEAKLLAVRKITQDNRKKRTAFQKNMEDNLLWEIFSFYIIFATIKKQQWILN